MTDVAPMLKAIRDVCLGVSGSVRTVQSGALRERAYPSTVEHEAARVLVGARFEPTVSKIIVSKSSPWENSPVRLLDIEVRIRTEWTTAHELIDAQRLAARARAISLLEDMRAALMRPGNLTTSSDGSATGIVSGCMHTHDGHTLEREDWTKRRLSYVSTYTSVLLAIQQAG